MRYAAGRAGEHTRRSGADWIASTFAALYRGDWGSRRGEAREDTLPADSPTRARFIAHQVLHDPTRCAFRLDDGSLLVLDERMPRDFVAVASRTGAVVVRSLTR